MNKNVKRSLFLAFFFGYYFLFSAQALAVCPVCTVAVGAGLGLSRYLGIDDAVSGIWIGGLTLSMSFWLIDWISKKKPDVAVKKYQLPTIIIMYLLVFVPLWYSKIIGEPGNTIFGIDKLIVGSILGTLTFVSGVWLDKYVRKIKGKQLIQFQKVVFPISSLVIASTILFILMP